MERQSDFEQTCSSIHNFLIPQDVETLLLVMVYLSLNNASAKPLMPNLKLYTTGSPGPQGPNGYTGYTGATGISGRPGVQGATGPTGRTGATGWTGTTGTRGEKGPRGDPGRSALG